MQATNSVLYLFIYMVFFGFSWRCKNKEIHRLINDEGVFTRKPKGLLSAHIMGIIWLGLLSVILLKHTNLEVLTDSKTPVSFSIVLYVFLLILMVAIALEQSNNAYKKSQSASESLARLSPQFFLSYFSIRALFLFSYELWFRGLLLFDCIHWVGVPLALFINITLYVLIHIFNGKIEALVCIPFGLFLCFFSILFNSAWPAIILHIVFSLGYEMNFFRLNLNNSKTIKS